MPKTTRIIERLTKSVGSVASLVIHTIAFVIALLLGALHILDWDTVLLVLTTAVSLEAIYLAIFIQMAVNQNTDSLREVEVDVDEIQKDIDAIEHDVDVMQEDEAQEEMRDAQQLEAMEDISTRLQKIMIDLEAVTKHRK